MTVGAAGSRKLQSAPYSNHNYNRSHPLAVNWVVQLLLSLPRQRGVLMNVERQVFLNVSIVYVVMNKTINNLLIA